MTRPALDWLARAGVLLVAALALLPLARLGADWVEFRADVGLPLQETPPRGFDGVRWEGSESRIVAGSVFPRSPGAVAGVRAGDHLVAIDYMPVDSVGFAVRQVERATGTVLTYTLERDGQPREATVRIARFPTFLYPLSGTLWTAATWGFAVVAYLHLLAYLTIAPLARRSRRAQRSRVLIGAALLWVGGNLLRLLWVRIWGAPPAGATLEGAVFDGLTLLALTGWIAYPLALLDAGLRAWRAAPRLRSFRWAVVVPPAVLGFGIIAATISGHLGPLPPDAFVVPVLFYVCVYVAAATGLALLQPRPAERSDVAPPSRWSLAGSALVCALSVAGAVWVWTQVQPAPRQDAVTTAWFITGFQLFSLLPVALVSLSTLRYGQFDVLFLRGLATLVTLTLAFAVVALGAYVLDVVLPGGSHPVALGAFVVVVLTIVERAAPALREWAQRAFRTERQEARRLLDQLGNQIRFLVDVDRLAEAAVETIGKALDARSAVVYLLAGRDTPDERWVRATFRPEAPRFTQADLDHVWLRIRTEGQVWARNEELNESDLPVGYADRLDALHAALAVPVTTGRGEPVGLLVLGRKARRFAVYNTEDVDRLRAIAAQLALAVERLRLIDRERALVRQTAEAELAALRAQINPHFLFNALNTVAALIAERPADAEETVEHLAGLFRDVLTASGQALVPLRDEIRLVERYLAVEQARFGDALGVTVDVPAEAREVPVPAFAVQTLVENAVKHGIERKRGGGCVTVRARLTADALVVDVADTGAGLAHPLLLPDTDGRDPAYFGVGLSNVAQRLRQLYGSGGHLRLRPDDPGTLATLTVPLARPAAA